MKTKSVKELVLYGVYLTGVILLFSLLSSLFGGVFFLFPVAAFSLAFLFVLYLGFQKLDGIWSSLLGQGLVIGFVFSVLADIFIRLVIDLFYIGELSFGFFYRFSDAFSGNLNPLLDFVYPTSLAMIAIALIVLAGNKARYLVKK